jgi:hypothetical protein
LVVGEGWVITSTLRWHTCIQATLSIVPAILKYGGREVEVAASVDTGASYCLFAREFGEILGLDVEDGLAQYFTTANSRFKAYGQELTVDVLGIEVDTMVFFFADEVIKKNVLGRRGWLDRLQLGLLDYAQTLYLARYVISSI